MTSVRKTIGKKYIYPTMMRFGIAWYVVRFDHIRGCFCYLGPDLEWYSPSLSVGCFYKTEKEAQNILNKWEEAYP